MGWTLDTHGEREPIRGVGAPSGVKRQSPWSGVSGKAPETENLLAFGCHAVWNCSACHCAK